MSELADTLPRPAERQVNFHVRATPEWVRWLEYTARRAEHTRSGLIAAGLLAYARENNLDPPPSRIG